MKKYLAILLIPVTIGLLVIFFPRPANAENQLGVLHNGGPDEDIMSVCSENIWDLFYQLQGCPVMMEEVIENDFMREAYLCASKNDCVNCAAILMFKLQQSSKVWDDTLGESETGETVVEDVVYLLHEETLLNEQNLQQVPHE